MSSAPFTRRKFLLTTAAATSSAWLLAACGGGGEEAPPAQASASAIPQADIDKALDTETTLTFWTWVPDIKNEVKLFTDKYPKIKVDLVNVGQGAPHYQKLRTAIQAGQGAPDVAQMEFQYIPSFTLGETSLLDLTPYAPATIKDNYADWVWSQVNVNGGLWGIPQDTGPMGLLYRDDLLSEAGIEAPKTWDDFAAAAEAYHSKNPEELPGQRRPDNQPGQIVAYLWQAGVRPFSFDGKETVKVDLAGDEAKKVVKFWGDLVTSGVATSDADFNDSWYQGLAGGKWATLPIAAWGPVFLQGTAGKTSGKWRAVRSAAVGSQQDRVEQLGRINRCGAQAQQEPDRGGAIGPVHQHRQGVRAQVRQRTVPVPGDEERADGSESFVNQESKFYGGQKVNEKFAQINETVSPDFGWLPFMDYVYSNFNETLGKAFAEKTDAVAGLQAWNDACAKYAKDQGFTVS